LFPFVGAGSFDGSFEQRLRVGYVDEHKALAGSKKEATVILQGWSANKSNRIHFHNQAMLCCRASTREISKRRAPWHDRQADAMVPETSAAAPLVEALPYSLLALQCLLPCQLDEALGDKRDEGFFPLSSSSAPLLS
jgi:hypothetical protein